MFGYSFKELAFLAVFIAIVVIAVSYTPGVKGVVNFPTKS